MQYWLIDFELAVHLPPGATVCGPPNEGFMRIAAPEVQDGNQFDPFAVDVYALGMLFVANFLVRRRRRPLRIR